MMSIVVNEFMSLDGVVQRSCLLNTQMDAIRELRAQDGRDILVWAARASSASS